MKKTRALIFDLDGTAIDSPTQKLPSARLISAVNSVRDKYYVCAATGRPWLFAKDVLQALGLVDPCIISGGAQVCDPEDGAIQWQCDIDREDVLRVQAVLAGFGVRMVVNDYTETDYFAGGISARELDPDKPLYYIDCLFMSEEEAGQIAAQLDDIAGISCSLGISLKAGLRDLCITNKVASKEHAVDEVLSRLGVTREDATGFGDGMNDIHLFNAVGKSVAMGNALPGLKEAADEVVAAVSADGLAAYLERLV